MFDFKISILKFCVSMIPRCKKYNLFHALYSHEIYIYFLNVNIRIIYLNNLICMIKDILKLIYISTRLNFFLKLFLRHVFGIRINFFDV
jgi:hypothetical protein